MESDEEKIRLVVDTNIVIAALIKDNSMTARLISLGCLDLYYPSDGLTEIKFYRDYITSKRTKATQSASFDHALNFVLEFMSIVPSELYSHRVREAYDLLKNIDERDTPFLALAIQLDCPIWSNDKHFRDLGGIKVYHTESLMELLRRMDIMPQ